MSFFIDDDETAHNNISSAGCRFHLAFDVLYQLLIALFVVRTCITSYMNVKFSRELATANREFWMVFTHSKAVFLEVQVDSIVVKEQLEVEGRRKANRLS